VRLEKERERPEVPVLENSGRGLERPERGEQRVQEQRLAEEQERQSA
jgi:hypothetical protein